MARENRVEVLRAIADHLATQGSTGWEAVRARFPGLAPTTFWRWVRQVKAAPPLPEHLHAASERLRVATDGLSNLRTEEAALNGLADIARHIPAAPSPATVARCGGSAIAGINFLAEFDRLFQDALALRQWSVRQEGGGERIISPRVFDRAISQRLELLSAKLGIEKQLWDLQRMEAFYSTIIEAIAAAAPEVAQEIQRRLAELNAHLGVTCDAIREQL